MTRKPIVLAARQSPTAQARTPASRDDSGWSSKSIGSTTVKEISREMSGIDDCEARNRQTMSGTLERLAGALEAPSTMT